MKVQPKDPEKPESQAGLLVHSMAPTQRHPGHNLPSLWRAQWSPMTRSEATIGARTATAFYIQALDRIPHGSGKQHRGASRTAYQTIVHSYSFAFRLLTHLYPYISSSISSFF